MPVHHQDIVTKQFIEFTHDQVRINIKLYLHINIFTVYFNNGVIKYLLILYLCSISHDINFWGLNNQ